MKKDITVIKAKGDDIGELKFEVAIFEYFMGNPIKYLVKNAKDKYVATKLAINHLSKKFFAEKNYDNCYFIDDMVRHPENSQYLDESLEDYERDGFLADNGRVVKVDQVWIEQIRKVRKGGVKNAFARN